MKINYTDIMDMKILSFILIICILFRRHFLLKRTFFTTVILIFFTKIYLHLRINLVKWLISLPKSFFVPSISIKSIQDMNDGKHSFQLKTIIQIRVIENHNTKSQKAVSLSRTPQKQLL